MKPVIKLRSGFYFDFTDPEGSEILIGDIAFSLAHLNRYTGHRGTYSVAQHSATVSQIVPAELCLEGLLHDAAEFVLNDLSSPLKSLLPDYRALEERIMAVIAKRFNLVYPFPPEIKHADKVLLATEVRDIGNHIEQRCNDIHDADDTWAVLSGVRPLARKIVPLPWYEAAYWFLDIAQREIKKRS